MNRTDLIVVGAGPAGMSAAIEAAKRGAHVTVLDENSRPGGQLFKQIHKFFGSKEHHAKVRGFVIGEELMEEAARLGVDVRLDSTVIGLYQDKEVVVREGEEVSHHKADAIVIATGAAENMVTFEGWTCTVTADWEYPRDSAALEKLCSCATFKNVVSKRSSIRRCLLIPIWFRFFLKPIIRRKSGLRQAFFRLSNR